MIKNIKMKKTLLTVLSIVAITTFSQAQEVAAPQPAKLTKEQKEAAKAKKEAELAEAFKSAGLTADEEKKAREVLDAIGEKSKAIKIDATLSEDARKAKLDELNKEKNDKLKEVMGETKFKAYQQAKKKQKEAAAPKAE